jgi:methyl-accepting chemotaxis protein
VSEAVGKTDEATQQNAAMVEQSTAATQSLSRQAERLADLVGQSSVGRDRASPPASIVFHASLAKAPPPQALRAQKRARRVAAGGGRGWEEL